MVHWLALCSVSVEARHHNHHAAASMAMQIAAAGAAIQLSMLLGAVGGAGDTTACGDGRTRIGRQDCTDLVP